MNKKIINGALLGLLVVAAPACSFVSCKDYDDDFASIRKEINADKADLVAVKNDLNGQITTLKGQLEAANKKAAEIEAKLADYAKKSDLDAYAKKADLDATNATVQAQATQLQNALANIAALETKVTKLEEAKATLQTLIDGKVDKKEFNDTVADILSKIKAVQGNVDALEKACNEKAENLVKADKALSDRIDAQKTAIEKFEERLKAVETKNFLSAEQIEALKKIATLEQGVADNKKAAADNKTAIGENKTAIGENKTKITNLQTALDQVNVDLGKVKEELAKRPTKEEVEALIDAKVNPLKDQIAKINERLNFLQYNLLVGLELIPDSYYRGIEAIESNQFAYNTWTVNKLVNGVVDYQVNPTQATATKLTSRYAEAVYHLNPAGAKIDTAAANFTYLPIDRAYRATNSAAVITVKKATVENGLLKLVLDIKGATKDIDVNKEVTTAALQYKAPGETPRIITSAYDAIYTNEFSKLQLFDLDKQLVAGVNKNSTTSGWDINNEGDSLAIAKKVRTNGVQKDGTTIAMDQNAAEAVSRLTKNGFHYEYHLVKTDANDKSFEAFTLDSKTGLIKSKYDEKKPFVNVGKTATVRVTLVQGKDEVATLGFFTVHISQKDAVIKEFTSKNELKFTCDNKENAADKYEAKVVDLAAELKAKAELEANAWEFVKTGGELTQYTFDNNVAKQAAKKLGKVTLSADGKNLVWDNITKEQVATLRPGASVATYVKVQKKSDPNVRFYVKLTYNPASEQAAPVATFAGERISNDWFKNNIRTDEKELRMHFYIEPNNTQFNRFDKFMYSINESYKNGTVKIAPLAGYSQAVLTSVHSGWRFVTPKETVVPGNDGKQYTLKVSQNGLELLANNVVIAKITNDQEGTIELLNNPTTQVLLNNAGHKQLKALETLTARVGYVTTVCAEGNVKTLTTKGENEFDVKFLRPLDLNFDGAVEFLDANIGTTTKTLDFTNIVKFTDWRDRNAAQVLANDHVTMETLYGVTTIYVANEAEWTTNLNGDNIATTKLVMNYGDRGLHMTGGTPSAAAPIAGFTAYDVNHLPSFTYTTQQKAFKDYQVRVPVKVGYSWGTFNDHITVTIKGTLNNDTNNTRRK
ncbi:MAG: hypothetical protein HXL28_00615 [Prevotellaceae bacterium]|nr:hypothetical protein [Prevotellaceae bacterium]